MHYVKGRKERNISQRQRLADKIKRVIDVWWMVAVICILGVAIPSIYYGGSPFGVVNGKYYLTQNFNQTEVPKQAYELIQTMWGILTIPIALSPIIGILAIWRGRILDTLVERKGNRSIFQPLLKPTSGRIGKNNERYQAYENIRKIERIPSIGCFLTLLFLVAWAASSSKIIYCLALLSSLLVLFGKASQLLIASFIESKNHKRVSLDSIVLIVFSTMTSLVVIVMVIFIFRN